jgi:carbonic anhydrase
MTGDSSGTLRKLMEGNARFISERGSEVGVHAAGQSPKAVVLTCADSRVIPEKIFDADIGGIFVVRVAGNVAFEASVLESLEYAVEHLDVDHIIILGHTNYGAVKAAEQVWATEGLLKEIAESFELCDDHVRANVERQVEKLMERSQSIRQAVNNGQLKLVGAIYHLENGKVELV